MIRLTAAFLAAAVAAPVVASAQEVVPIRAEDQARLDGLNAAAGEALRQVLGQGDSQQIADATRALRGAAQAPDSDSVAALAGDWSCRMTKLGGNLPAVSYPPFRCRFAAMEGVMTFEKLTGSQRTRGFLRSDGERVVYLGSSFVQGEEPRAYDDFPETVDLSAGETLPDVGVLEVTGPGSARILFPRPNRESVLNVLTLTR